jgi:hypothetical protein
MDTKENCFKMKKLSIILGLLIFSQAAFAGGTVLFMNEGIGVENPLPTEQIDPNATLYTQDGVYGGATKKTLYKKGKFRWGRGPNYNDPNVYWNFGNINFGSGFTSVGSGDKKY